MGALNSFQSRYCALRQCIITDGIRNNVPFHEKDLLELRKRADHEGSSFIEVTLPLLGKALDMGLVSGGFLCPLGFSLKGQSRLPRLFNSVFQQIFGDDGRLLCKPNIQSISFLRQILLLDSKLEIALPQDVNDRAVDEFVHRMSTLRSVRTPVHLPQLQLARRLLGRALKYLDLSDIVPGHGPGSVAERLDKFERWDFSSWPVKAERFYPYLGYGVHSLKALLAHAPVTYLRKTQTRCCLVPKDFKGPRLISSEYSVNQYLQQGQLSALMKYVKRHPLLSKSIKLDDQTFNQRLAMNSFADDSVTVDLSAASDTISVPLVWYLFGEVPEVRRRLMATRSDFMIHKDRKIKITSFAPMGSATCFPVETLVFWSLSMASILHARRTDNLSASYAHSGSLGVFGDDIVIPRYALSSLESVLIAVGCSLNKSKTCVETPFRESCGSEWFNGIDVTVIRNRQFRYNQKNKFRDYPVLLDLQRKFFLHGLFCTANQLKEWASEIFPVPTVSIKHITSSLLCHPDLRQAVRGDGGIAYSGSDPFISDGFPNPDNYRNGISFFDRQSFHTDQFPFALGVQDDYTSCSVRYNRDLQRSEVRLPIQHQRDRFWCQEGYPRLMARLLSDKTERLSIRDFTVKMAWSWVPGMIPPFRGVS